MILLAYIATAIGFPMRVFQAKDGSQPFICQNHVCRCHNAQDCWQHCCCYSAQEKLAWAQEQHVEPPAYAETAKPRGWHNLRRRDRDLQRESGASASSEDAVAERASACKNGCCSGHQPPAQSNRDDNRNKRQNDEGSGAAPTVSVLKCRCPSTTWVSTGAIVIASPAFAWNLFFLAGEKLLPSNQDCLSYLSIPPDPPPRCL